MNVQDTIRISSACSSLCFCHDQRYKKLAAVVGMLLQEPAAADMYTHKALKGKIHADCPAKYVTIDVSTPIILGLHHAFALKQSRSDSA